MLLIVLLENGVKKLLFLGSSCIYPKNSKQPMKENSLLTGVLENTNEPYAISKIAGIKNFVKVTIDNLLKVITLIIEV